MRDLSNATGIGSGGDFVNGDLVDDQTQINEFINQDPIQFFQKLADLAGIVFNDLPDNETNDYQLIEALETVVRTYVATTLLKGTVEKATQAESDAGTADKFPDAAAVKSTIGTDILVNSDGSLTSIINIGDWDMSTATGTNTVTIAHGLADYKKIRHVSAFIYSDDDAVVSPGGHPLSGPLSAANTAQQGGVQQVTNTNVILNRLTSGVYDSTDYNETPFNRGYIKITYVP